MNLLDIIGPVMVGPSSSHTAGAVKIGRVSRKLLAEEVKEAKIYFHGSFLATGKGHGTDKALIAGLLGMQVDDPAIPDSFRIAGERGMDFSLEGIDLGDVHPNSVKMNLTGDFKISSLCCQYPWIGTIIFFSECWYITIGIHYWNTNRTLIY